MNTSKSIRDAEKYILLTLVLLFALFVFPKFPSPFTIPKEIFGAITVFLVLILWSVRSIIKKESVFFSGKFDLGVFLLTFSYVLSGIIKTPNKMEVFFFPGTVTFVVISALAYFLINQFDKKTKGLILTALFGSGILLSISTLFTQLGLFAKIPQLPEFMKLPSFNPTGGLLPAALFLSTTLALGISFVIKEKDLVKRIFFAVASVVLVFGLTVLFINLLPGKPQSVVFPSIQTSWEITIEALKKSPVWGMGSGNYVSAFNLFRPLSSNQTSFWATRFSTAANYYFTLITELGFVGLGALSLILIGIYRSVLANFKQKNWEVTALATLVVLFAFFPGNPVLFFTLMVLLSVFSKSEEKSRILSQDRVPSAIISAPIIIGVIVLTVYGFRAVAAEVTYKKSLDALAANNAIDTYNLMTQATTQNPSVDRYHASLAQVDMAIATAIANNPDLTDTDRNNITQLIGQAINEGKATVSLNPGRSGAWELLAQIYKNIMPFAQGADQFAIQTYTQAVALDPINPNLRISLGGVYYALGRYDEAIDAFKLAVLSKPDLANAHYNLAIAYRDKKDYDNAITEMNNVISLLPVDSTDYNLAKSTLEAIQKSKPAETETDTTEAQNLTTPQAQEQLIQPPIELPEEATPPASTP